MVPSMPRPLWFLNLVTSLSFLFFARLMTACAMGCSLFFSRLAAMMISSSCCSVPVVSTSVASGFPLVSVPVLSKTIVFTFFMVCMASPFLMSMPRCAPMPDPTTSAMGVASPSAQGHAMTSTAMPMPMAVLMSVKKYHAMLLRSARMSMAGTNLLVILSASSCMGTLVPCASSTSCMICARKVSFPILLVLIWMMPSLLMVAPMTGSLTFLSTGRLSPVTMLSSMLLAPLTIMPSTGIFSPGLTMMMSPKSTSSMGSSCSSPLRRTRAFFAPSSSKRFISSVARPRAFASMYFPVTKMVMIMLAMPA